MSRLATWEAHPEGNEDWGKIHLRKRMKERVPVGGLRKIKQQLPDNSEVPEEKWFLHFGDFVVVGKGVYFSSYLGLNELGKVEGYELRCWWNSRKNPTQLKKCWRNRGMIRASLDPAEALFGSEER
jgi:hypothetical protein